LSCPARPGDRIGDLEDVGGRRPHIVFQTSLHLTRRNNDLNMDAHALNRKCPTELLVRANSLSLDNYEPRAVQDSLAWRPA